MIQGAKTYSSICNFLSIPVLEAAFRRYFELLNTFESYHFSNIRIGLFRLIDIAPLVYITVYSRIIVCAIERGVFDIFSNP